ncbi:unnamed protein product [Aspergillus oryzae var. brunneus]|uniref:Unnamed protein product n=2 Tax=Aspergillus oryzae TaxID=5062 RepID=A0AAN4YU23_ASPOZ|nr:unnamed protein product [Aspergillus oryzae]GMG41613.1 unnamed protein product [Aspergillus oryzae var. brunneus]
MVRLKIYEKAYEEEFGYPASQFESQADVTPVMIVADDTAPLGRYVDFNTMHKCRNFWDIRAWVDQNKVID